MLVGLMSNCFSAWCLLGCILCTTKQNQTNILVSKVNDIGNQLNDEKIPQINCYLHIMGTKRTRYIRPGCWLYLQDINNSLGQLKAQSTKFRKNSKNIKIHQAENIGKIAKISRYINKN